MSEVSDTERAEQAAHEKPAIGLVADADSDTVAGAILRAQVRGYEVFLLAKRRGGIESVRFADRLGATVIVPGSRTTNGDRRDDVRVAARDAGFPGVIYHEDPSRRIDFERSEAALRTSEQYVVDAYSESVLEAKPTVLVGIPGYDEASSIGDVVREASVQADEVLVVDDGSTDETAREAREAGAAVVEHERNRGYGAALKTIFREAERSGADHLVILDGDGQHDAADVPRLVERQRETGAEIVIGCRFDEESETKLPLYRRFGLGVVNALTNLSLGVVRPESRVRDTQSGFRCYDRRAIETLAEDATIGDHMGASTDILHHAHTRNYGIEEVATTVSYDVEDASSHNPVRHGITLVSNLLRTIEHERPLLILGVPGFVLAALGIGFGYWAFSIFISGGVFPVGLAVTSVFFTLTGVFSGFTAIILHALQQHLGDLNGARGR